LGGFLYGPAVVMMQSMLCICSSFSEENCKVGFDNKKEKEKKNFRACSHTKI
jgi:hypothetical protein